MGFHVFAGICTFNKEVKSVFVTCLSAVFSRKLVLGIEQMQQALPVGNTTHKKSVLFLSNGLEQFPVIHTACCRVRQVSLCLEAVLLP